MSGKYFETCGRCDGNGINYHDEERGPDLWMAKQIVDFLNSLLLHDRITLQAMIMSRFPCSNELRNHPTVQVAADKLGGCTVGLLGLLNGLCGIHTNGSGPICAAFDSDSQLDEPALVRFGLTKELDQPTTLRSSKVPTEP